MKKEEADIIFDKIEFILGFELPKELKDFYSNEIKINDSIQFMDLNDIYYEVVHAHDDGEKYENLYKVEPENSILKKAYDKKRIPFIKDDTGNFIGLDYNPGECGILGQIINYGGDEDYMKVFASCFEDFIDGIKELSIPEDEYITDYLIEHNLNFRKEVPLNKIPKKIDTGHIEKSEIQQNEVNETVLKKEINMQNIKEIIDILQSMNNKLQNDLNVKTYKNYWFNYRIINKKDSLSRTMETEKAFYEKLDSYEKEEIKGYSFAITNYIEELRNEQLLVGEERIFVEIDMLSKKVLIRYTQTIDNKIMKDTYEEIIKYIQTL